MGAAVLAAKSCLRSGVGLLTVHLPQSGNQILQSIVPEAMVSIDQSDHLVSDIALKVAYKAVGIGPGVGQAPDTVRAFRKLLETYKSPMVIDADALNILSSNPEMMDLVPINSIFTPHPVEFERLVGVSATGYKRLQNALKFAQNHNIILILKGAYTAIVSPDGKCWFNSTGNPGMATGGSGDVLTGILTGLLAQAYSPTETAILGVYLHGLAGDFAAHTSSMESMIAGDLTENLGKAFTHLKIDTSFGKPKKKVHF
jgi:NAD(P)H-hydrate epimerase